ncbi:alpha-hydroxy acid oxidase [Haloglycomyces albus]|uniref:alpha-hydroxy acid oxidase n=1 Tax=Haloglycomyces albus TaxID=526067 RepID=UPI00046CA119|nr:alpha-hydroxy acid oxidase [Haloglycomyces albus]
MQTSQFHTIADVEAASRHAMPRPAWDYISGGAGDEVTMRANRDVFEERRFLPRMLREVSTIDSATTVLGAPSSMPFAVAPMAYQKLAHPDGELATARAAREQGVPFHLATMSSIAMETVVETPGEYVFQLYWLRDRDLMAQMLNSAETFGCRAVVLTVDAPVLGQRVRDTRHDFSLPDDVHAANLMDEEESGNLKESIDLSFDSSLKWDDLAWIRENCSLPLIVKGILHPDDARAAVDHGASAIVVSNHGGRQLDQAVSSLEVLPVIREAVGPDFEIVLDSGIRSGRDVLLALARGADSVLIGRPILWGLAAAGEAGVNRVLELLGTQLTDAMAQAGARTVAEAKNVHVW